MKFLNIPLFIISLAVGFFFVYLYNPDKKVIYVYPTPDNIDKVQYTDNAQNCFIFKQTEINCPSKQEDITNYDIQ